ncbi:hypothetical protein GQ44DRAFT_306280 [Phaeosphaeriaceae sp. PMI808]|nr:hypothetical protein GQ44DRAFT_306280 [Phaeosphaeriaceae sp. PMI808]
MLLCEIAIKIHWPAAYLWSSWLLWVACLTLCSRRLNDYICKWQRGVLRTVCYKNISIESKCYDDNGDLHSISRDRYGNVSGSFVWKHSGQVIAQEAGQGRARDCIQHNR